MELVGHEPLSMDDSSAEIHVVRFFYSNDGILRDQKQPLQIYQHNQGALIFFAKGVLNVIKAR